MLRVYFPVVALTDWFRTDHFYKYTQKPFPLGMIPVVDIGPQMPRDGGVFAETVTVGTHSRECQLNGFSSVMMG